jgi:hypothetical protein
MKKLLTEQEDSGTSSTRQRADYFMEQIGKAQANGHNKIRTIIPQQVLADNFNSTIAAMTSGKTAQISES